MGYDDGSYQEIQDVTIQLLFKIWMTHNSTWAICEFPVVVGGGEWTLCTCFDISNVTFLETMRWGYTGPTYRHLSGDFFDGHLNLPV